MTEKTPGTPLAWALATVFSSSFPAGPSRVYDDVNRQNGANCEGLKYAVAVDGAIESQQQPVIVTRKRQDLNLIGYLLNPFDLLDHVLGVALEPGTADLTHERDGLAFHPETEVVKQAVERQVHQFPPHFPFNSVLSLQAHMAGGKPQLHSQQGCAEHVPTSHLSWWPESDNSWRQVGL